MKYLVVLRRIEIWLLLAVVGFVIVYAFKPTENSVPAEKEQPVARAIEPPEEPPRDSAEPTVEERGIQVEKVAVFPTESGRIVEVTFAARSRDDKTVVLDESVLKATTNTGAVVQPFFEPFRKVTSVYPDESSLVSMKFWLEEDADEIWLDFQGEKAKAALPD